MQQVYLAKANAGYKVGFTQDLKKRKSVIQTHQYHDVDVLATFDTEDGRRDERTILNFLHPYNIRGEWFDIPSHLIEDMSWFKSYIRVQDQFIESLDLKKYENVAKDIKEFIKKETHPEDFFKQLEVHLKEKFNNP